MAGVVLEGVSRVYPGGVTAVESLDLDIADQEFMVLVGPSGCGKSTTLRLIAGLEEVTKGTIRIGDRVVNDVAPKDRDIAMVFQNYALYPHMTVYKNMAFGLRLRYGAGLLARLWRRLRDPAQAKEMAEQRRSIPARVRKAAESLGIERLLDRLPAQLSGGERQRVALGRAIVRQPAVFLFDEPLSNLDAKLRVEMRRELKQLHRRLRTTMIYVTHDQIEAMTLGDRIVVLSGGAVQQVGTPWEVYHRPANRFVASFLGTPPMNFIAGELTQITEKWRFTASGGTVDLDEATANDLVQAGPGQVTLGIRPEDVQLSNDGPIVGRVEMVEPQGDSSVVQVGPRSASGDEAPATVLCKVAGGTAIEVGAEVRLRMEMDKAHWFRESDGRRIRLASRGESAE